MTKKRDFQRKKVYVAEDSVPHGLLFDSSKEIKQYIKEILRTRWWKNNYPNINDILILDDLKDNLEESLAADGLIVTSFDEAELFIKKFKKSKENLVRQPKINSLYVANSLKYAYGDFIKGYSVLYLPLWARKEIVVIHELIHSMVISKYGYYKVPDHGVEFTSMYLEVVKRFMGPEFALLLESSFDDHRVKYSVNGKL